MTGFWLVETVRKLRVYTGDGMGRNCMKYRKATLTDSLVIASMYRDLVFYIKNTAKDVYWDFEDFSLNTCNQIISEYFENDECCIIIAEEQDEVVGMIMLEIISCQLPISSYKRIGYISAAYVKEAYRGNGIMHKLEELSNDFFRSLSIKYVEVNYLTENKGAREAWNSLGYSTFREQGRKCII